MQTASRFSLDRSQKKFLVGALLAMAFFLIAAGIAEIAIAVDQNCRDSWAVIRFSPDPFTVCLPEWKYYGLRAVSRGVAWVINPETSPFFGWLAMSIIYGFMGGVIAQGIKRQGILLFLGLFLAIVAMMAGLGYLMKFIA